MDKQPEAKAPSDIDQHKPEGRLSQYHRRIIWIVAAVIVLIAAAVIGTVLWLQSYKNPSQTASTNASTQTPLSIAEQILNNKFGFLGGAIGDTGESIAETGAAWIRPHPGPFVWDMMQTQKANAIDFTDADAQITAYQQTGLGTLATLWPFAEWSQPTSDSCKVADSDEFLPKNDSKGRGSYLPAHRCNPTDWNAYKTWVQAVVERYDGDGTNDMPGLKVPVKYWEAMNEPDLSWQPGSDSNRLTFYRQGPDEYGELLKQTYTAIKSADPTAQVLIAGAAGGSDQFIGFYSKLFADMPDTKDYFDIGNVHCISNDQNTHDFNVGAYKDALAKANITKPIWVTEAEAMYGKTGEQNYQNTKTSTAGALAAGAERIFYTRYQFDDTRTDMSKLSTGGNYPSAQKYRELFDSYK